MNSGATAERVNDVLKRRIMDYEFRPGDRLDPSTLAKALASSATPVREALHVLTGERLVETRPSDGFHLPQVDERALKDLYAWNDEVIRQAVRGWPKIGRDATPFASVRAAVSLSDAARDLFARIADRSTNAEHGRMIASLNARLHAARTVELHIIDDIETELRVISEALEADDRPTLLRLTTLYHRRRFRAAADIVRALYRTPSSRSY